MTIYKDFSQLVSGIITHVARTKDTIVCEDGPKDLLIGFRVSGDPIPFLSGDIPKCGTVEYKNFVDRERALRRAFFEKPLIWCISLSDIRRFVLSDEVENSSFRHYICGTESRKKMAEAFSKGERIWERKTPLV